MLTRTNSAGEVIFSHGHPLSILAVSPSQFGFWYPCDLALEHDPATYQKGDFPLMAYFYLHIDAAHIDLDTGLPDIEGVELIYFHKAKPERSASDKGIRWSLDTARKVTSVFSRAYGSTATWEDHFIGFYKWLINMLRCVLELTLVTVRLIPILCSQQSADCKAAAVVCSPGHRIAWLECRVGSNSLLVNSHSDDFIS